MKISSGRETGFSRKFPAVRYIVEVGGRVDGWAQDYRTFQQMSVVRDVLLVLFIVLTVFNVLLSARDLCATSWWTLFVRISITAIIIDAWKFVRDCDFHV